MAYSELTLDLIRSGKAAIWTIFDLLADNFEDHEDRIVDLEADAAALIIPIGMIFSYGNVVAPPGYLACDGSAVSRTAYSSLFAVIGTYYGVGDGSTTFNVPDMRGRTPIGAGTGTYAGATARTLGDTTIGEENHVLLAAEMPVHTHTLNDPGHTHDFASTGGSVGYGRATDSNAASSKKNTSQSATSGISLNNAGSGTAHNNMQPSEAVPFIIKT